MSTNYCGIVMPISAIGDCSTAHWQDVKEILHEAITTAGYVPRIVSLGEEVSIIHERIVKNLYSDEIVVCDVSCKNANVMFELGLRLAFDKPVIIVKDDATDYSFDTGPIEHLTYPRSLRFAQINTFKAELNRKIVATVKAKQENPNFSPFLSSFGPLKSAKIDTQEVSSQELMLDYLSKISSRLDALESTRNTIRSSELRAVTTADNEYGLKIRLNRTIGPKVKSDITYHLADVEKVDDIDFIDTRGETNVLIKTKEITDSERSEIVRGVLAIVGR